MRETIEIEHRLQAEFDQTPAQVRRIITSLTPDDRQPFTAKMNELRDLIDSKRVQVKDKRSYCNRTFTDFIQTLLADKKKAMQEQMHRQADLAAAAAGHGTTDGTDTTATHDGTAPSAPKPQRFYTEADLALFQQVKDRLSAQSRAASPDDDTPAEPNANIDNWLPEIQLYKVDDDTITIAVPTRAFHESFIHYFGSDLLDRIEAAFSRQVGVCFLKQF